MSWWYRIGRFLGHDVVLAAAVLAVATALATAGVGLYLLLGGGP